MEEMHSDSAARQRRRRRLERFARSERIFPGGDHPTGNCTACARIITRRFGGEVRGYYHVDNPEAAFGETEFGHDFAVTGDGFLVDPWLFHYYGEPPVLDLHAPEERAEAVRRYGPQENWRMMPGWEEHIEGSLYRVRPQVRGRVKTGTSLEGRR